MNKNISALKASDVISQQFEIKSSQIQESFLMGYCDIYAMLNQKFQIGGVNIPVVINDDSNGKHSLYHVVSKNIVSGRYYDANGLIAFNIDSLRQYIRDNYSESKNDFSIISNPIQVADYLEIITGLSSQDTTSSDQLYIYIESNLETNEAEYLFNKFHL